MASKENEPARKVPSDLWLVQLQPVLAWSTGGGGSERWKLGNKLENKTQHHNRLLI